MSSFILFLMLSANIRANPPYESIGHCLVDMLRYFGTEYNPNCTIITQDCIIIAQIQEMFESSEEETCSTLFVADPFHPELNAAAKVTRFAEIKKCFAQTYECMLEISKNFHTADDIHILDTAYKASYVNYQ